MTREQRLEEALREALSYIRSCEIADVVPRSDGHGYQDAEALLSPPAAPAPSARQMDAECPCDCHNESSIGTCESCDDRHSPLRASAEPPPGRLHWPTHDPGCCCTDCARWLRAKTTELLALKAAAKAAGFRAGLLVAIGDVCANVWHHRDAFDQSGDSPPYDCRKDCCYCAVDKALHARLAALDRKEEA